MWKEAFVLLSQRMTGGARECNPLFPALPNTISTHDPPDMKWRRQSLSCNVQLGQIVRRIFNDNVSTADVIYKELNENV
jgi:hypothetical protein